MAFHDGLSPALSEELAARLGVSATTGYVLATLAAVGGALLVAYLAHNVLVRWLRPLAARSRTQADDVLTGALRGPIYLFALLLGVSVAILVTPSPAALRAWAPRILFILLLAALVVVGARVVAGLLNAYGGRAFRSAVVRSLVRRLLVLVVYTVGFLLILDNLGLRITPLLTTLGLAGLAIALALQDTLSNFFAGLWMQAERPIDVGDYVRVEDIGVEGFVAQVGWRTTKIRTLPNNQVIIPNARLASSVVTDFSLPEPRIGVRVEMRLAPGVDTRHVERVLLDEARRAAGELPGFLMPPEPFVRFNAFSEYGLDFALHFQVASFVDQYAILHEMRHRLHERLPREGIHFSFPIRIQMQGGSAPGLAPER
ncbi:MAG TPA: mechanosensitive ion channel domain-containing protein [Candidatus Thermoplasmatota archaeon]|nr:mechanosensitive ion channel domain-containing protein [Candidatus Thermoplasmatota archaeon]